MRAAIVVFPGTNRERDMAAALKRATGSDSAIVWHGETALPRVDLIVLGSYGGRSESIEKIFFGATAEKVIRTAGCAVLTVPLPARKIVT